MWEMIFLKTDPSLDLALNLKSLPGGYALLLGSGISRSAGIPTGWDIVLDLINQLATLLNEEIGEESSPEQWYKDKFGEEADYSKILDKIADTQPERMNIIKKYFEPTEEERNDCLKVPTAAHQAIARLVKKGYIRIILTTNFDRLLEKALENEGVNPDIIASEDDFDGVLPYVHSKCVIFKIHGDYRDTRIKNTIAELETYSDKANQYLDRILDEFGLVICGWSATWDIALRNGILRSPNRRFSTFWLTKGKISAEAEKIVIRRAAKIVEIDGADQFFLELIEKIESLEEFELKAPLSTDVAVATVKRYLVDPKYRIRLHDIFYDEIESVWQEINDNAIPQSSAGGKDEFQKQIKRYEIISEKLIKMLTAIAYYGKDEHYYLIYRAMERLGNRPLEGGLIWFIYLKKYIALLILYSTGLSALTKKEYKLINNLLFKTKIHNSTNGIDAAVLSEVNILTVFRDGSEKAVPRPEAQREYTPVNNYLYDVTKPILSFALPGEVEFERSFDRFEFLLSIAYLDLEGILLPGCYQWRNRWTSWHERQIRKDIENDFNKGSESELIKAGFFNGEVLKYKEILDNVDKNLSSRQFF